MLKVSTVKVNKHWKAVAICACCQLSFINSFEDDMSQAGTVSTTQAIVPVAPLKTITDFDDFLANPSSGFFPKLGWSSNKPYNQSAGTATNPGIIVSADTLNSTLLTTQNTNSASANSANFRLGGGVLQINWLINLGTLSNGVNRYTFYSGLSNLDYQDPAPTLPTDGCFFRYSDNLNSGKWQIICGSGGVYTTTNTTTTAATGFVNLGVAINAAGTSVVFTINGTTVGTIGTNIPTATSISPFLLQELILGALPAHYVDLFYYTQTLTTARPG